MSRFIKNNKFITDNYEQLRVYKLSYGICPKVHTGQNAIAFKKRIVDHQNLFKNTDLFLLFTCNRSF